VVVLRVIFEDLLLLGVLEVADQIIEPIGPKALAPCFALNEPIALLTCVLLHMVLERTSSQREQHRTCGLAGIAAVRHIRRRKARWSKLGVYKSKGVESLSIASLGKLGSQNKQGAILFWCSPAWVTWNRVSKIVVR
jgi:hypothetical protein